MTPESVTIVLPLPAKVLQPNCTVATMGGRFMKAAAIKRYRRLAKEAVEAEYIETVPWEKITIQVSFFFGTNRHRDPDNAAASLKAAYDGFVDARLIEGDTYGHMKHEPPIFRVDRNHPRVELTITRLR